MSEKLEEIENNKCAYCGGELLAQKELRDGYEKFQTDADAYCFYFRCRSCAATTGWAKSGSAAVRLATSQIIAELRVREKELTRWLRGEIEGGDLSHDFVENLRERLEVIETAEEKK